MKVSNSVQVLVADMPKLNSVIPYLRRVEESGIYSNFGPLENELRSRYSNHLNVEVDQIRTCSNATIALSGVAELCIQDEIRVPNWTFPATGIAACATKKNVRLIDIELEDWLPNFSSLDSNSVTYCVEPFGVSVSSLQKTSNGTVGHVVVDAAASLGNFPNLSKLPKNWVVVFSLHATKILGCGEGSLVVFGSAKMAEDFKQWSNFGFKGSRLSQLDTSTNGKLSEIHCAYALASLDEFYEKRDKYLTIRKILNVVSREIGILPDVLNQDIISPYWIVKFKDLEVRNRVEDALSNAGVETRRWWPDLLSNMKAFSSLEIESNETINALELAQTTLGLPFHIRLTEGEITNIAKLIDENV